MIRAITLSALAGAVLAGGIAYSIGAAGWRDAVARWSGGPDRRAETAAALEELPICTTMAAAASDADWAQLEPDFKAGKKALGAQDWKGAIAAFELAALRDPLNADIQNYIGYAYRRLRQLEPAMGYYQRALALNPRHRSAHEHIGEVWLVLGEPAKAEHQLGELENLCLLSCTEYDDLKQAIAVYKGLAAH